MAQATATLPRPWVKATRRGLRVEIPSRYASYTPVLLGAWLAAWVAASILLALGWAGVTVSPVPRTGLGVLLTVLFAAAGAVVAWRLAWVLRGRERIHFSDGVLTIARGLGDRGGRPRRYLWEGVRDLRVGSFRRRVLYPSWGRRFVGKGDAYVAFRYGDRDYAFGRGLRTSEARDLVELLRSHATGD